MPLASYDHSFMIAYSTVWLYVTASASVVFCANEGVRGGKVIPLKGTVDEALVGCDCVKKVYVMKRTDNQTNMVDGRDVWLEEVCLLMHML